MVSILPEELLKEVFRIALHVPDHLFYDVSLESPFSFVEHSKSGLLLVCKRWLRGATPVFYETLILRSNAQVMSLCNALAAHRQFACLVKRLRLEGRVPEPLGEMAKRMTSLQDVCLAFNYTGVSAFKFSGFTKFLRALNPQRAAFVRPIGIHYSKSANVNKKICQAVSAWTNLTSLMLPYSGGGWSIWGETPLPDLLLDAVKALRHPLVLTIPLVDAYSLNAITKRLEELDALPRNVTIIFSMPDIHLVDLKVITSNIYLAQRNVLFRDTRNTYADRSLTDLSNTWDNNTGLWTNPLSNASPEVQSRIWEATIRAAMIGNKSSFWPNSWFQCNYLDHRTSSSLLHTSKFFSGIVLAVLAERLEIFTELTLQAALTVLQSRPQLFKRIRHVSLNIQSASAEAIQLISAASELRSLRLVLQAADGASSRAIYDAISLSAPTLQHLFVTHYSRPQRWKVRAVDAYDPDMPPACDLDGGDVLGSLDALTRLHWIAPHIAFRTAATDTTLSSISEISTVSGCDTFLHWLVGCRLTQLVKLKLLEGVGLSPRQATLDAEHGRGLTTFLETHGAKLKELHLGSGASFSLVQLNLCCSVTTLKFGNIVEPNILANAELTCLKVLIVEWLNHLLSPPFMALLNRLYQGLYPVLEELRVENSQGFWPSNESGTDSWQVVASEKLKARGVTLKDTNGHVWRSRLDIDNVLRRSGRVSGRRM
ncbi:hypothetical protein BKA62DRAFT_683197 [Auriculariales sp. MPI-PUGE-AT-0066]|nr:hypothetical protein BKA62DRAFT_683197 [Auriculariales sp. MPI-PUGE-AT-0066]